MKKNKQEAEMTRLAILQSALDVFCEKGYSKTTFDEIAKRILLTKGAVYWHFRNKPDMVAALINEYATKKRAYLMQKVPAICCVADLIAYFKYAAEFITKDENNLKFAFFTACQMEWSEGLLENIAEKVAENKKDFLQRLKEGLTFLQKSGEIPQNYDTDKLIFLIHAAWIGVLEACLSQGCPEKLSETIEENLNLIFEGLKRISYASK